MGEPEPPGAWQYQGGIGPSLTETLATLWVEGFVHSAQRDADFLALAESERVARNPDWVVTRAVAVDVWNIERNLLA